MRTIKELLIVVRSNRKMFRNGLCYLINKLYRTGDINCKERRLLSEYIENNGPSKGKYIFWRVGNDSAYWWTPCAWTPRYLWLTEQILKN